METRKPTGHRLPPEPTPFVGRAAELAEIGTLLAKTTCRLLTLVGPGGIGKTRLALRAAQLAPADLFPDGVYFAALAPVRAPEFTAQALTYIVEYCDQSGSEGKAELLGYLRDKHLLLVVDNFEHLLAGADLLAEVLAAAPGVKLLVTSRERLNLQEEWLYPLRGLDYPQAAEVVATGSTVVYSAVELFMQTARRVRPAYVPTSGDLTRIADICRLVEGMPLGLELAAAWVQMLSVDEIADEIRHSLDFLSTSTRNLPERHRSLRAVFEYSWNTLDADERAMLADLSVFCGGFTLEAAWAIAVRAALPPLRLLLGLVSKSLVRREADNRYVLHELLRQFAEGKLSPAEHAAVAECHAVYFADYLAGQLTTLKSAQQARALDAIRQVMDDVREAWGWAVAQQRWPLLQAMLEPLILYTNAHLRMNEVSELYSHALAGLETAPATPEARLLSFWLGAAAAQVRTVVGTQPEVLALIARGVALLPEFSGRQDTALPCILYGILASQPLRMFDHVERFLIPALHVAEAGDDRWLAAFATLQFGWYRQNMIQYGESRAYFEQALVLFQQTGQPWGIASTLSALAENDSTMGDFEAARQRMVVALPLVQQLGDRLWETVIVAQINKQHDYNAPDDLLHRSLEAAREVGHRPGLAWALYHGGGVGQARCM